MHITDPNELILLLREKLSDYLLEKVGPETRQKTFRCFAHDDNTPSMHWIPGEPLVYCHSGCGTFNIFRAAETLERLSSRGPDFFTETLPALAEKFDIPFVSGVPSPLAQFRATLFKIYETAEVIIRSKKEAAKDYVVKRNWASPTCHYGSIQTKDLYESLIKNGFTAEEITSSRLFESDGTSYFFGDNLISFPINDVRGRCVGFISRHRNSDNKPKWIHTPNTDIFDKNKNLFGAEYLKDETRVYIFEGLGEVYQLRRLGLTNSAACFGTAFSREHIHLLRSLGITEIVLAFDWDEAGQKGIQKIINSGFIKGFDLRILASPDSETKDLDELLKEQNDLTAFNSLERVHWIDWLFSHLEEISLEERCSSILNLILQEPTEVRRETLLKRLSIISTISYDSLRIDLDRLVIALSGEQQKAVLLEVERYSEEIRNDPGSIASARVNHEQALSSIEEKFNKGFTLGVNAQLERFETNLDQISNPESMEIRSNAFSGLMRTFSEGYGFSIGLGYLGGYPHHGKTAFGLSLMTDIALTNENAIVLNHSTDDAYRFIETRVRSNIARAICPYHQIPLRYFAQPAKYYDYMTEADRQVYEETNVMFKQLLRQERLVLLDLTYDGSTLSVLERNLKFYRNRYPDKFIFVFQDNTHNLSDHSGSEAPSRMTAIANGQKYLAGRYKANILATAEYKKRTQDNPNVLYIPKQDDFADSRALMYRPDYILHVVNDLKARGDKAEYLWTKKHISKAALPRLLIHLEKDKLAGAGGTMFYADLDPTSVSVQQIDAARAVSERDLWVSKNQEGRISLEHGMVLYKQIEPIPEEEELI